MLTDPPHRGILAVALTATFMQLLDVTIAQVAIPSIRVDLHADPGTGQLVLAGYALSYACLLVTAARLGDRYGYRRIFVAGLALFGLASVGCSLAPTGALLVAARLVQGAGSGLMAPQVLSIIQTAVPAARRPHALGLFGATMGVASLAGPLLGGVLLEADLFGLGWRLIFLVNAPVAAAAIVASRVLPATRASTRPRLDILGATLAMLGLGLLILPLALGQEAGWPPWTWLCLTGATVALVGFTACQRPRPDPLVHPAVLSDRATRAAILLVLVFNAGVPSFTYLLLLYLQTGAGLTPLAAAAVCLPFPAAAILGSRLAPGLARRWGAHLLVALALMLAAVTSGMAAVIGTEAGHPVTPVLLAVGGAAFGAFIASAFSLALTGVPPDAVGSASGLLPTAQQLGGSIGVTLAGLAYFAPADTPTASFRHAMAYEAAVFLLAAAIGTQLTRTGTMGAFPRGTDRRTRRDRCRT